MPDANDTITYQYDALRRIKVEKRRRLVGVLDRSAATWGVAPKGREAALSQTRQDNSTVTLTYDLAGRMTERDYSDSTADTFEYDAASRLTQSTKGRYSVTTEHEYFPDSAPETETFTFDSRTYSLSRTYDAANRPVTHTFGDGKVQTWFYDDRNLVTSSTYETESIFTQLHDAGYRLTDQTFGNGLTRKVTYSRLDNLRNSDIVKDGVTVIEPLAMTYSYSPDKQVTVETFPNGSLLAATGFGAGYDAGNRVTSYTRTGGITPPNQTWKYDDNGNWISTTLAGQTDTRTHNADNELTSGNTTYDARGNMTKDPDGNEYHYDLDNRIFKIEMHQGPTVEFLYDATGRRVQSKQGSTKTAYLWWGDQECSEHKHQAGQAVIQNDLWAHPTALNTIIARAVDGSKYKMEWYHKNYLDHVYAVSDDSGDIIEHYRYSAFGIVEFFNPAGSQIANSQIANPVLWNSRRYDESTKLHYYKYRHYIPKLGRWTSRDPIEEEGGINVYEFVDESPLNYVDVLGLEEQPILSVGADTTVPYTFEIGGVERDGITRFFIESKITSQGCVMKIVIPVVLNSEVTNPVGGDLQGDGIEDRKGYKSLTIEQQRNKIGEVNKMINSVWGGYKVCCDSITGSQGYQTKTVVRSNLQQSKYCCCKLEIEVREVAGGLKISMFENPQNIKSDQQNWNIGNVKGCNTANIVAHEIGHSLGNVDEHSGATPSWRTGQKGKQYGADVITENKNIMGLTFNTGKPSERHFEKVMGAINTSNQWKGCKLEKQ
jgi:RHS repeat-associated protein